MIATAFNWTNYLGRFRKVRVSKIEKTSKYEAIFIFTLEAPFTKILNNIVEENSLKCKFNQRHED